MSSRSAKTFLHVNRPGFFRAGYSSSSSRSGTINMSICTVLIN